MRTRYFLGESSIASKDFLATSILLFNTFTWYYMAVLLMSSIISDFNLPSALEAVYYTGLVLSSLVGALLSSRMKRRNLLYFWIITGTIASLFPALLEDITANYASIVLFCLGITLGIGMPSCLAYFANCTTVESRGRLSGLVFLTSNLSAIPIAIFFANFGLLFSSLTAILWRALGLILFFFLPAKETILETRKNVPFKSVLNNRPFILYFIPWLMFSLIDRIEYPILIGLFGPEFYGSVYAMKPIIGAFFALIGGLLSDLIGRKRVIIYGFVALGIAYAVIGINPTMLISWYFYHIVDSIAAGIFSVVCVLILWGDLSPSGAGEKYYAVGILPLFLASIIPPFLASYIELIPPYAAFSLASFFLFVAVLPLMYAPETLPEKKLRLRQLQSYAEKAKKLREKYSNKSERS